MQPQFQRADEFAKQGGFYVIPSKISPEVAAFANTKKRPPDEFETDAFANLMIDRSGFLNTDVVPVIKMEPDNIRMVGALRATADCLHCHSERTIENGKTRKLGRGEVIGALVYSISRLTLPVRGSTPSLNR